MAKNWSDLVKIDEGLAAVGIIAPEVCGGKLRWLFGGPGYWICQECGQMGISGAFPLEQHPRLFCEHETRIKGSCADCGAPLN